MSLENGPEYGRRNYDVEIATLQFQVLALQKENAELKADIADEIKELRADIKDLLEAFKTAKGMTAFVKWIAALTVALGVIVGSLKGWKL